jgi:RNA polymerase sigma factor for flagellar operon FliA
MASQTKTSHLNTEKKERLAEQYLHMVYLLAREVSARLPVAIDINDLVSAGQWGLFQALESYRDDRETRFITYAKHRIRGAILDELRKLDPVGRSTRSRVKKLEAVRSQLRSELGRDPEEAEVDAIVPLKKRQKDRTNNLPCLLSMEQPGVAYEVRQVNDKAFGNVHEMVSNRQMNEVAETAMEMLPQRDQKVLKLYYFEDLKLHQVANEVGLENDGGAWQLRSNAVDNLRKAMNVVTMRKRATVTQLPVAA